MSTQPEKYVDSLGQENPAVEMERANLKTAQERSGKAAPAGDESVDYESLTVAELKDLAHKRGITVTSDMRKDEIIDALEKG